MEATKPGVRSNCTALREQAEACAAPRAFPGAWSSPDGQEEGREGNHTLPTQPLAFHTPGERVDQESLNGNFTPQLASCVTLAN